VQNHFAATASVELDQVQIHGRHSRYAHSFVVEFEIEIEVGFEIDSEAGIEVAVDVEFQEVR
jgi:hypothetical protein